MHFKVNFTDNCSQSLFLSADTGSTGGIKLAYRSTTKFSHSHFPFTSLQLISKASTECSTWYTLYNFCKAAYDTGTLFMLI